MILLALFFPHNCPGIALYVCPLGYGLELKPAGTGRESLLYTRWKNNFLSKESTPALSLIEGV